MVSDTAWLSVDDVVQRLGVRKETVYRWISGRGLPAHKVGKLWLFRAEEVDAWVRGKKPSQGGRPSASELPIMLAMGREPDEPVVGREIPTFVRRPIDEPIEERLLAPAVGSVSCPLATADGMMMVSLEVIATKGNGSIVPIGAAAGSLSASLSAAARCIRAHHESMGLDPKWLRQIDLGVIVQDAQPGPDDGAAAAALVAGAASVLASAPLRPGLAVVGRVDERGVLAMVPGAAERARAALAAGYQELLAPAPDAAEARAAATGLRVTAVSSCPQLVRQALSATRMKYSMVEKLAGAAQLDLGS